MDVDELRAALEAVVGIVFADGPTTEWNADTAWDVANALFTHEVVKPEAG
jgi:predicted ABC-type transport system involved in lysophospholipase L1 biosynthesis ATPase subunit